MIVAAAISFHGMVCHLPRPARHHDILRSLKANFTGRTDIGYLNECQGFLSEGGDFLTRVEAYKHAVAVGQALTRRPVGYDGDELFSEDLW